MLRTEPAPHIGDIVCEDAAPEFADETFGVTRVGPRGYEGEADK